MLGFPILYCKGMRPMRFQLSGFCYKTERDSKAPVATSTRRCYAPFPTLRLQVGGYQCSDFVVSFSLYYKLWLWIALSLGSYIYTLYRICTPTIQVSAINQQTKHNEH